MKVLARFNFAIALLCGAGLAQAQQMPEMPSPTEQHEWLQHFVGEWESEVEIFMEPGKPPLEVKATERYRPVGDFWVVAEIESQTPDMPFSGVYTLGYDPEREQYIGTWIESMSSHLTQYKGSIDATGKVLTTQTEGPCPMRPGEITQFKETTEFKSPNHKIATTNILVDGEWITNARVDSRRTNSPSKITSN